MLELGRIAVGVAVLMAGVTPGVAPGPAGSGAAAQLHATGEYDGVRAYRRGDPLKLVVWKKAARSGELVSRDTQQAQGLELWLDLAQSGLPADPTSTGERPARERALSRLCAWVLAADRLGVAYGLRLGPLQLPPATGEAHRRLAALLATNRARRNAQELRELSSGCSSGCRVERVLLRPSLAGLS